MLQTYLQIQEAALKLPPMDQLHWARAILQNYERERHPGAAVAWREEIEQRIRLVDSGSTKARPWPRALEDLDRRLNHEPDHPARGRAR